MFFSTSLSQINLTVNVFAPPSTPKDSTIYLTGNHPSAGEWNPAKLALKHLNDSLWTTSLSLPDSFNFEFKLTLGTWNNEAIYVNNETPSNTTITMKKDTTITIKPLKWKAGTLEVIGHLTGNVKYHRNLKGEGLSYERDVIVWLPPSYNTAKKRHYPVLYMHDGQNIVDPKTSFTGYDWRMDEVSDSLIKKGSMKEIIIVGINNTPDRREEYADSAKGIAYQSFIIHVVKQLIDSTYRTLPDRDNTGIMGSSMGGLASFLMAWNHPQVFSMAACLSPAFSDELIKGVKKYKGADKHIRLYIDNGGTGLDLQLQPGCDKMLPVLKKKGFSAGKNLQWFLDAKADHNERAWAKRVWRPLKFMFGKKSSK